MKWLIALVGVGAVAAGTASYFDKLPVDLDAMRARLGLAAAPAAPARGPGAPVQVSLAPVEAEDVAITLAGIGTVQPYNMVAIKTRVDGEVTQVLFQEGQDVKAGDPLAIIDPRPLQAQLQQQEAMRAKTLALLEGATLDLRRYESLIAKNFSSQQQLDQQRALVEQYRAQSRNDEALIDYARTQLGYTTIRSPIAGRTGIRQVDQGNMLRAAEGATIVVISQLQPISVVFTLPAAAVMQSKIGVGQVNLPVIAFAADETTELDRGTVELVDNQVDQSTGTIKLKAKFPNDAVRLWPGNFINGRIVVETRRQGLTVPSSAVRHGPRGDFAWVARADNTVEFRTVTTGQTAGGRTLVERGLRRGEQVVTEGHFRLEQGSRIEINKPPPGQNAPRPAASRS